MLTWIFLLIFLQQPAPLAATWEDRVLHITIANPAPTRCLELVGGNRPTAHLPGSCGVAEYTLPLSGIDANYAPAGRVLRLVESGGVVYEVKVPGWVIILPIVVT